jgi:predicted glycoside hydrolase/deacetylase ChbG (UPF0249 family)
MHARPPERGQNGPVFSLVFPAYNPGPVLERTLREVIHFLRHAAGWEVVFVCDGCTDGSSERLQELARHEPDRVRVVVYTPNRGKGYAVRRGLVAARGPWRLFTDVDLAYGFDDVLRVAETLRAGAEVAIASRWHPDSRLIVPPALQGYAYRRHLQSLVFSTLVRWLLPLTQRDTQAGLKGLSARVAQLLLPRLRCDGFEFDCELLTACARYGVAVAEVPVHVRYEDSASTTSVRTMGRMIQALWQIRRAWVARGGGGGGGGGAPAAPARPHDIRYPAWGIGVDGKRYLVVTADDYGIGPATSVGILELALHRRISATVLLVTAPYAATAVQTWKQAGRPLELGWHPCLTLDRPILPPARVPSLVDGEGRFWSLGPFLQRLCTGRIHAAEMKAELHAQYQRYCDLVGCPPTVVNSHHHVQVFPPIGTMLCELLKRCRPTPYIRRVREPWSMLAQVHGARVKRAGLSFLGHRNARRQQNDGFPGNDWLAGITDPPYVADPSFFTRWLTRIPGQLVELTCHPGYLDTTLIGRDCTATDGQVQRRVREWHLLQHPSFTEAYQRAGFRLVSPTELFQRGTGGRAHAA